MNDNKKIPVLIWGMGKIGKKTYQELMEYHRNDIEFIGFGDNNVDLVKRFGVLDFETVCNMYLQKQIEYIIQGIGGKYIEEVVQQFLEKKIEICTLRELEQKKLICATDISRPFTIDLNNLFLKKFYQGSNYEIIEGNNKNNKCIIFCSSNGIYFPNYWSDFIDIMVKNDRYEWKDISTKCLDYYEKIIFIRDVYKSWYITGINEKLNTMEKTVKFLEGLLKDYRVDIVGSSAGGYMSLVIASQIQSENVFVWGAQTNLYECKTAIQTYPVLNKYIESKEHSKFCNLSKVDFKVKKIYFFFAEYCEYDQLHQSILNSGHVKKIALNSKNHAQGFAKEVYPKLFKGGYKNLDNIKTNKVYDIAEIERIILFGVF